MNFAKIFFFVFACVLAISVAAPAPKFRPFKKLEQLGKRVRDGIIKAGPAIEVIGKATDIMKGAKGK